MPGTLIACTRPQAPLDAAAILALFIERVPAAVAMFDTEMRYLAVSREFLSALEISNSPAEVIGRSYYETFPDMPPHWRQYHARALAGEEMAHAEDALPRRNGRIDWVRWTMKPWRLADGEIGGALLATEVITDQVEARHALAESEARFRATFENAAVGISHVTPDGRLLRVNKALSRILGWPAEELITKSVQDITHPDDIPIELARLKQLQEGKADSFTLDKRDLRKDGTIVWIRRTVSCVRRSDGAVDYFVSVVEDISERKRAEEQVHLLMREANHRVRNLLGLVQAIARQTAAGNPEDFVDRFTDRIRALAANQDLLGRNRRQGADVEEMVRAQLAHFADLVGSRITVHGPKLRLNATAAQTIGLALHELATNAGKYGALSTDSGRIDVGWQREGESLMMSWTERNGPPVHPPDHRGFGTTVIDSMTRRALDGDVRLDYAPSGLAWRLTCPAGDALERP